MSDISSFAIGNGAWCYCAYQMRVIDYLIEDDTSWNVYPKKEKYNSSVKNLETFQREREIVEDQIINGEIADLTSEEYDYWTKEEERYRLYITSSHIEFLRTLIIEKEKEKVADGLL